MIQETRSIIMNLKSEKFQIDVHRTVYVYVRSIYCSFEINYARSAKHRRESNEDFDRMVTGSIGESIFEHRIPMNRAEIE